MADSDIIFKTTRKYIQDTTGTEKNTGKYSIYRNTETPAYLILIPA